MTTPIPAQTEIAAARTRERLQWVSKSYTTTEDVRVIDGNPWVVVFWRQDGRSIAMTVSSERAESQGAGDDREVAFARMVSALRHAAEHYPWEVKP